MKLYVIDTNVILMAGTNIRDLPGDQIEVYEKCIHFIHETMAEGVYVLLDDEHRVLDEYRKAYGIDKYPNNASVFLEYVFEHPQYVHLEETGECVYKEFPDDPIIREFDPPDRKFIALAYVSDKKPPIIEATDSKWWGIVENLKQFGIEVRFIDDKYIMMKYKSKMG